MKPLVLDPADDLERQNEKLRRITAVLMNRIEREIAESGPGYSSLQLAATLEKQVRMRTRELDDALRMLSISNARLSTARLEAERARNDLYDAFETVQEGFALFDPKDKLILSNSRFSAQIPDVAAKLGPGLGFIDYVRMVARSPHLVLPPGRSREDWVHQRLADHRRPHAMFVVNLTGDRWIQVSAHRSPSGGTAVVQTDVTDMIRREREERDRLLDDQARLVRATLDHINQGVAIFDERHRLAGWNRRLRELVSLPVHLSQTGTDFGSILACLKSDVVKQPDAALAQLDAWTRAPAGRPALAVEIQRSDGSVLDMLCQEMPDSGFVVSFTDMTVERRAVTALHCANENLEQRVKDRTRELEAARDQAERAQASKSRFVAGVSHDLLQPLNAAKLFLSTLSHTHLDEEQRVVADRIASAFESVESILGALLDISNLDVGTAKADIGPVPLGPLLTSIEQQFQPLARERGLRLTVMPTDAWVESDPAYLRRILQNLAANALRYTRRGKVLIGARPKGDALRIDVCDTGPGIPPSRQAEIFREFVRLDTSPGAPQGMGLGLAIVERSCALLGHPLALASAVGRGTRFSVTVPRALGTCGLDDAARPPPFRRSRILDDMIVVVIDTDDAVRAGMVSVLADWGASPLDAADLASAEALIVDIAVAPDAIIADDRLEGGRSGLDAIARLRARSGHVPAVLIAANRTAELRQRAAGQDVTLLNKPLELHRLRAVLHWAKTRTAPSDCDGGDPRPMDN